MTAHRGHRARMDADRLVLERLTPLDVSNLRIERHGLPMNVAALAILEGRILLDAPGGLALEAIRARIEQRLHRRRGFVNGSTGPASALVPRSGSMTRASISAGTSGHGLFLPVAARKRFWRPAWR